MPRCDGDGDGEGDDADGVPCAGEGLSLGTGTGPLVHYAAFPATPFLASADDCARDGARGIHA
jgi:hypothetical protein